MESIDAVTVAQTFFSGWIARFGTPHKITMDQGRQFESNTFRRLNALCGTTHLRTTAYHPASNGLVERLHRQLKAAITCHSPETWTEALPIVLLGFRAAWKEDLQSTSAELVYGEPLRLPGEFLASSNPPSEDPEFVKQLRKHMQSLQPTPTTSHGCKRVFTYKMLTDCTHVFVRQDAYKPPLQPAYNGPYQVLNRDEKKLRILINGRPTTVSADRVKPAFLSEETEEQQEYQTLSSPVSVEPKSAAVGPQKTRLGRAVRLPARFRNP